MPLDAYYDGDAVRAAQASHQRLKTLERTLNHQYGAGRVKLRTYQQLSLMSATIADPGAPDARGVIEFHLFRGAGRYRMITHNYPDDGTDTPLIQGVLDAVAKVVRLPKDEHAGPSDHPRRRRSRQDPGDSSD